MRFTTSPSYHAKLTSTARETLTLVLIIEEAHHVLYPRQGHETTMERLLRQCRELGIGIIVIDQHPHLISSAALGNTYTTITLNLKDPKDTRKAAQVSLLRTDDAAHLSTLPVGRAIVKLQDRWHHPFLIDIPHIHHHKGHITDDKLRAYLTQRATLSATRPPQIPRFDTLAPSRLPEGTLDADHLALLEDVIQHPEDGVDTRYKRLGISADKGHRRKVHLRALRLLEEERITIGRTRKNLLRLTRKGQQLLTGDSQQRRESLAHAYWKHQYAARMREQGYDVRLEAPRPTGGNTDVLASRPGKTVAIEIETGKSGIRENTRRNLLAGYTRVLIVAITPAAWIKIHRALDTAGLLIPRVSLLLRDDSARRLRHDDSGQAYSHQ